MRLPMVDCRSLIEFCKAFEQHKNMADSFGTSSSDQHRTHNNLHSRGVSKKQTNSLNPPLVHPFCKHSPLAAVDVVMLLLVIGALGFLTIPYFQFVVHEASEVLPTICDILADVILNAPVAYVVALVVAVSLVIATIAVWEFLDMQSRKCRNPYCKGLRKAVAFDIQLESEECVKFMPTTAACGMMKPLELGQDHKELEAELKRMAPLNGRTVLICRAPCGCPAGRLEVWGPKKIRRLKK